MASRRELTSGTPRIADECNLVRGETGMEIEIKVFVPPPEDPNAKLNMFAED